MISIIKDQIKRVYDIYYGVKIAANKTFTEKK